MSYFEDVGAFHEKFELPRVGTTPPGALPLDVLKFRGGFLLEELAEFFTACGMVGIAATLHQARAELNAKRQVFMDGHALSAACDLPGAGDALVDLTYVALGTAHMMGLPFDAMWSEVQRANMSKERATGGDDARSKRGHALDVVKPAGWTPPDHRAAIAEAFARFRSA